MPCANQVPTSDMIPAPTSTQILRVSASRAHLGAGVDSPHVAELRGTAAPPTADEAPPAAEVPENFTEAAQAPANASGSVVQVVSEQSDLLGVDTAPSAPEIVATQNVGAETQNVGSLSDTPLTVVKEEDGDVAPLVNAPAQPDLPNVLTLGSVVAQLPVMSVPAGQTVELVQS